VAARDFWPAFWPVVLQKIVRLPDPPLLIVTSRLADERLWAEALNLGAWDVLAKPLDRQEVSRVLNTVWLQWNGRREPRAKAVTEQAPHFSHTHPQAPLRVPEESATSTYVLDERFATALKNVRAALENASLVITGELNLAARIQRTLRIGLPPCVVLFASSAQWTPPESALDPFSAAMMPLHIVVSARGARTEVHILRTLPGFDEPLQQPGFARLAQLQSAISHAVERLGMRSLNA
jgi:hypothetical protein